MPSDIAKTVLFFGSDASSGCTNQDYVVDKGWLKYIQKYEKKRIKK